MEDIRETRLKNLRILVAEQGSIVAVARLAHTAEAYLSQILNRVPHGRTGTPRSVGHNLARKLEAGCSKPAGWMDVDHGDMTAEDSTFLDEVKAELAGRDVPEHLREAFLTLLRSAPKKGKPGSANDPNGPDQKKGLGT